MKCNHGWNRTGARAAGAALLALALALAAPALALVSGLCLAGVAASHGGIGPEGGAA